jgi:hypothetical protein
MGEHALNQRGIQPWHQPMAHTTVFRPQFSLIHGLAFSKAMTRSFGCKAIPAVCLGVEV